MKLSAIIIILHVIFGILGPNTYILIWKIELLYNFDTIFRLNYTYMYIKTRLYTGENTYEWVCMGAYGCVVTWGARGTQKQIKGGRIMVSHYRPWFGPYGRGNFPGHHVLVNLAKWVQTASEGCAGVFMGAIRCICTGGQENKEKRGKNWRSGHILQVCSRATKHRLVGKDGRGGQREYRWAIMADQRARGAIRMVTHKGAQKNEQRHETKRKRASANWCSKLIFRAKKVSTKKVKSNTKKSYNKEKQGASSEVNIMNGLSEQQTGK